MMSRPYCVLVALLLLAEVSSFGKGSSNPGIVARVTREGLEYARQHGVDTLKNELSNIKLPDFSGIFNVSLIGQVSYDFHSLRINHFAIRRSELKLLPQQGVRVSLSNNYVSVRGMWKVKKAFISLAGSFDLNVDGIFTSVSLNLGKDRSGRLTASVAHCNNSIGRVSVDISGSLSWILNLFQERIENNLKNMLEQKVCETIRTAVSSRLQPCLQTLPGSNPCEQSSLQLCSTQPSQLCLATLFITLHLSCSTVTWTIDEVAGIDYRLVTAPMVSSQGLHVLFKGEFFNRSSRSPVPSDAPAIMLPQIHDDMVYFAVSEHVFNTASWVYSQDKRMSFIIRNEHIPLESSVILHTNSFRILIPKLASLYPNMEMELEVSPESAPFLMFTPGNVTLMAIMDIKAFAFLPKSSDCMPLFQLRATTNISVTIDVSSSRIFGSVTTGSGLKLELKQSNVDKFNVQPMETVFNYYAQHTIYPSLNAKLEEGFPLPLPRDTVLNSLGLQIHENFLLIGANID